MDEIKNFIEPRSIAVIGASDNPEKVGSALMYNLNSFQGKIIPINPKHSIISDKKCYPNISSYNGKIDLAIIAIPSEYVLGVLEECGKKGIKSVIVITAGYSEIGNKNKEIELMNVAKKYGMRILGPNCFGVANPYLGLEATFSKTPAKKGNIAFISQSGALWSYIADLDIGFSGFASLGNMADLDFSDFVEYFSKDKRTKYLILYMEKLKNGKRFLEIVKKSRKPVLVVKAGSSEQGKKAAISHTGSLSTDYQIYKGALKQADAYLCNNLIQALEKATQKKIVSLPKIRLKLSNEIVIITNAGGAGALAADYLNQKNIKVKITDILGTALAVDYEREIRKNLGRDLLILLTPQTMTQIKETAEKIILFKRENPSQKVFVCFLGKNSVMGSLDLLRKNNIPAFSSLEEFIWSIN